MSAAALCSSHRYDGPLAGTRHLLADSDSPTPGSAPAGASQNPNQYVRLRRGNCAQAGLFPVSTEDGCRAASLALGFAPQRPSLVSDLFQGSVPFGCSVFRYPDGSGGAARAEEGQEGGQLVLNNFSTDDTPAACGSVGGAFTCLCSTSPPHTGAEGDGQTPPNSPVTETPAEDGTYKAVRAGECSSAGLQTIDSARECSVASRKVGEATFASSEEEPDLIAGTAFRQTVAYGEPPTRPSVPTTPASFPRPGASLAPERTDDGQREVAETVAEAAGESPSRPSVKIASKVYATVSSGSCEESGMKAIESAEECAAATIPSEVANTGAAPPSNGIQVQLVGGTEFEHVVAEGCSIFMASSTPATRRLFNTYSSPASCGMLDSRLVCVCREKSADDDGSTVTPQTAPPETNSQADAASRPTLSQPAAGAAPSADIDIAGPPPPSLPSDDEHAADQSKPREGVRATGEVQQSADAYSTDADEAVNDSSSSDVPVDPSPTAPPPTPSVSESSSSGDSQPSPVAPVTSTPTAPPPTPSLSESSSSGDAQPSPVAPITPTPTAPPPTPSLSESSSSGDSQPSPVAPITPTPTAPPPTPSLSESSSSGDGRPSSEVPNTLTSTSPPPDPSVSESSSSGDGRSSSDVPDTPSPTAPPPDPSVSESSSSGDGRPSPGRHGYCGYEGCHGVPTGDPWCSVSSRNCGDCEGNWCPVPGYCTWERCLGKPQGSPWCNISRRNCNSCGGRFCTTNNR
eukprot:jgi/Tetstr1/431399/TSEL_021089.t1